MKKAAALLTAFLLLFAPTALAASARAGVFDFKARTVRLNSGYDMPIVGLGTYALDHDTCVGGVVSFSYSRETHQDVIE